MLFHVFAYWKKFLIEWTVIIMVFCIMLYSSQDTFMWLTQFGPHTLAGMGC